MELEQEQPITMATHMAISLRYEFGDVGKPDAAETDLFNERTYAAATGASVIEKDGRCAIQVTRSGGGILHSWLLSLRWNDDGTCTGFFRGDTPTDADLERLQTASSNVNFSIANALYNQHPLSFDDDTHKAQVAAIAEAIQIKVRAVPMPPAKRGVRSPSGLRTKHSKLPGGGNA